MNTVTFLNLISSQLHINCYKAIKTAEALYSKGLISYPRTKTNFYN